jgi:methionyl-tRNA formyltransferase
MLRVVFLGMDLRILDGLRRCPVHLLGVYLPPAPYRLLRRLPVFLRPLARQMFRRPVKTAMLHMPLARYVTDHHVATLPGTDVNSPRFVDAVAQRQPGLGVVANFGQILGPGLLAVPRHGWINFHPSLLPRYRGPTPLGHILLNRETVSGTTWHRIAGGIDNGDILAQKTFTVEARDTVKDLDRKSVQLAIDMLGPLIERIGRREITPVPQEEANASYCKKLTGQQKAQLAMMGKLT